MATDDRPDETTPASDTQRATAHDAAPPATPPYLQKFLAILSVPTPPKGEPLTEEQIVARVKRTLEPEYFEAWLANRERDRLSERFVEDVRASVHVSTNVVDLGNAILDIFHKAKEHGALEDKIWINSVLDAVGDRLARAHRDGLFEQAGMYELDALLVGTANKDCYEKVNKWLARDPKHRTRRDRHGHVFAMGVRFATYVPGNDEQANSDLASARWFSKNTQITSDQLRQAIAVDPPLIRFKKIPGGQNIYSKTDAQKRWGHLWHKPSRAQNYCRQSVKNR